MYQNGICRTLRNLDKPLEYIQTVIITHYHGDHIFDLPFLILQKSLVKDSNKYQFNIVGPKNIEEKNKNYMKLLFQTVGKK